MACKNHGGRARVRVDWTVMFHIVKTKSPAPFGTGVMLAEEEHEQKDDELDQLLVAQLELDCQCYHGFRLDDAGRPANWLRVGFGSNAEPSAVGGGILGYLTARLPPRRGLLWGSPVGAVPEFPIHET